MGSTILIMYICPHPNGDDYQTHRTYMMTTGLHRCLDERLISHRSIVQEIDAIIEWNRSIIPIMYVTYIYHLISDASVNSMSTWMRDMLYAISIISSQWGTASIQERDMRVYSIIQERCIYQMWYGLSSWPCTYTLFPMERGEIPESYTVAISLSRWP